MFMKEMFIIVLVIIIFIIIMPTKWVSPVTLFPPLRCTFFPPFTPCKLLLAPPPSFHLIACQDNSFT